MNRIIVIAAALVAAYVGFALYSSLQIHTAIIQSDAELLSSHIDFPSLRDSLKKQITAYLLDEASDSADENNHRPRFAARLIATIGPPIIEKVVDNLVTPSGLAAFLSNDITSKQRKKALPEFRNMLARLSIVGPTHLRLSGKNGVLITLTFHDWAWKVSSIYIPPELIQKKIANIIAPSQEESGSPIVRFGPRGGLWRTPD